MWAGRATALIEHAEERVVTPKWLFSTGETLDRVRPRGIDPHTAKRPAGTGRYRYFQKKGGLEYDKTCLDGSRKPRDRDRG